MNGPCSVLGNDSVRATLVATKTIAGHDAHAAPAFTARICMHDDERTDPRGGGAKTRKRFTCFLSVCAVAHGAGGSTATTNTGAKYRSWHRPPTI